MLPAQQYYELDTLIIDPQSIEITPAEIEVIFEQSNNRFYKPGNESVTICFRSANPLLYATYQERDIRKYESGRISFFEKKIYEEVEPYALFDTPNLYKSGTISRGITVGNRQNLFVNSTLNLQLSGKLSDELNINAVITDQNIPYQPEGNTQQVRDFDNVYIQIYNENIDLLAGDIVLANPDRGHFLKYYKNQQGLQLGYRDTLSSGWETETKISAAFAKGKFASTLLQPIEGVSGPYRLRGAQNERFIIVLANSEKVFIDGRQIERGLNNDYIIDYNQGEITFSPNIVITRFTRIRVDFEYTEQTYSRSNLLASQRIANDRMQFYFDFYREKDNQNSILGRDLSLSDRQYLASIGDDQDRAFISGVDSAVFTEERVLYTIADTLVNGIDYTYYKRAGSEDAVILSITFSEVGFGRGNYELTAGTINGREYRWVAPVDGQPQGSFAPLVPVTTPNLRQMGVFGSEIRLSKNETAFQELAFSRQDVNLFSREDDQNNQGVAWIGGVRSEGRRVSILPNRRIDNVLSFEFDQQNFQAIDRFRYIEFDRDWNNLSPQDSSLMSETLVKYQLDVRGDRNQVLYDLTYRKRGKSLEGTQQHLTINESFGRLSYAGNHFLLNTQQQEFDTHWIRSFSDLSFRMHPFRPGVFYNIDQNVINSIQKKDSVLSSAMYFQEAGAYLANNDTAAFNLMLKAGVRKDELPILGDLTDFTEIRYTEASFKNGINSKQRINLSVSYRDIADQINPANDRNIVQGRLIADNSIGDGSLKSSLIYSTANSRELLRQFVFTLVGSGQGTHTWRDENGDGVQDLNEFYEAINPDERDYIKIFVPTDQYIEAFQVQYNHTLTLGAPYSWRADNSFRGVLAKFVIMANWNINRKTSSGDLNERLNPYLAIDDDVVLADNSVKRYNFFYNRSAGNVGVNLSYLDRDVRSLNQNGFELRQGDRFSSELRWKFLTGYQILINASTGTRINRSDFLDSRNFELESRELSSELIWQPSVAFRAGGGYGFRRNTNVLSAELQEFSAIHQWSTKLSWSAAQKGLLNAELSILNIDFQGEAVSYLGYILLEGLEPGNNVRLTTNWQQTLKNGLQLTLQYFGRKSEKSPMIHSGTVQLTAFF